MHKLIEKNCNYCRNIFIGRENKKYCSKKCRFLSPTVINALHSKDRIKKIIEGNLLYWKNAENLKKHSETIKNSPNFQIAIKNKQRGINISNATKGKTKIFDSIHNEKIRQYRLTHQNWNTKNTNIEVAINNSLISLGQKENSDYYRWHVIDNSNVDFYFPKHDLIIEALGCFYHECKIHGRGFHKDAIKSDSEKKIKFEKNGRKIMYIWEHDIQKTTSIVKEILRNI